MEAGAVLAIMAVQQVHDLAHSALPDAPVRHDFDTGERPLRRRAARGLRRLADRLEPVPSASAAAR